ncbi:hypothetical protein M8818_006688 [Zalaria obscura]|uniref:Uncharacterized protein n=1 Tax=Zalaria obscura TaxID=2024903 RepID=A0ACC3S4N2_9PEZI
MPTNSDSIYTEFPPFDNQDKASTEKHDSPFEFTFEDRFEKYQTQSEMAGSGSPYIKSEPNDLFSNPHQFAPNQQHNGFNIGSHQSMSPPQATSLLAGGTGRRATTAGTITQGLPADDKDKGPNKGDILNGSVAWTRDLLWLLSLKLDQEAQLEDKLNQLGQPWPFERSDEEKRMRSEVFEVTERHRPSGGLSRYSRAHGTGLRVPHFTNVAGEPVSSDPGMAGYNAQSLSPGFQSGGSGMSSGQQQPQFWSTSQANFKEEDDHICMAYASHLWTVIDYVITTRHYTPLTGTSCHPFTGVSFTGCSVLSMIPLRLLHPSVTRSNLSASHYWASLAYQV